MAVTNYFPRAKFSFAPFATSSLSFGSVSGLLMLGLSLLVCRETTAQEMGVSTTPERSAGLGAIDWLIIAVYGFGAIGMGYWYGRKQESSQEYFIGSGRMNPILVGISLFATLLSTISYLSMPGESLGKGPMNMSSLLGLPIVFFIVSFLMLPVYMRQKVTSAYELLDERLGSEFRLLGAGMFIVLRLVWMALLTYATAKALTVMLGVGEEKIPLIALATGLVAVTYTSLGGLRAVVITDCVQTVLLYGGALLVLGVITYELGGLQWIPTRWDPTWDTQPIFSTNLAVRVTLVGTLMNYVVWYVATTGGDQTSVQRFMSVENAAAARRAFATQLAVTVIVAITLGLVGFALLAYFKANTDALLGSGLDLKNDADKIFPYFIAYLLPPGISGLVVAAMFAAAMSSIDSGVNSITAVVTSDFLKLSQRKDAGTAEGQRRQVMLSRVLAFVIGAAVVVASSQMGRVPGNITEVTTKTSNLLATPIFGLFFFALFVPFASRAGVWLGTILGTATAVLIAFSGPIFGFVPNPAGTGKVDPISFQWIAPAAFAVNVTAGCIVTSLFPDTSRTLPRKA